ncbi:hypothetical protein HDV62DRAFT_174946 [Trichoderma sp. SZMC 28011]
MQSCVLCSIKLPKTPGCARMAVQPTLFVCTLAESCLLVWYLNLPRFSAAVQSTSSTANPGTGLLSLLRQIRPNPLASNPSSLYVRAPLLVFCQYSYLPLLLLLLQGPMGAVLGLIMRSLIGTPANQRHQNTCEMCSWLRSRCWNHLAGSNKIELSSRFMLACKGETIDMDCKIPRRVYMLS